MASADSTAGEFGPPGAWIATDSDMNFGSRVGQQALDSGRLSRGMGFAACEQGSRMYLLVVSDLERCVHP